MTTANAWDPNPTVVAQVNANGTVKAERKIATDGQVNFHLDTFSYVVNTGSLDVYLNGKILSRNVDFVEVDSSNVLLVTPCEEGDVVLFKGFVGITGAVAVDAVLRNDLAASSGAAIVGTKQNKANAVTRKMQDKANEFVSVWDYYLAAEATMEEMFNRALANHCHVRVPEGIYYVNLDNRGVRVKAGSKLVGDGKNKTIIVATGGGSLAELAGYIKAGVIARDFNPAGPNAYVNDGYIADIGIVLTHPDNAITNSKIQIGFDMRNITGFTIERCHVGNIPPVGGPVNKVYSKPYIVQGYPVVFGTRAGSDPSYAGGEKNRFINNSVYGGFKCIVQDDVDLCGSSASYATLIANNDIQTGQWLIAQMGQYGAGNIHVDNILQDIQKQNGNVSPSYIQYYDGYNNVVRPQYIEGGANVDYQLFLDTDANNNKIDMLMAGVTSGGGAITDNSNANSYNRITYCGTDGNGPVVELYNKAYKSAWIKFHWDGANIVIDGSSGISAKPTRTGEGDYLIAFDKPFASDDYSVSIAVDPDASGHAVGPAVYSHSNVNIRILTPKIEATGVITYIDPRYVWVSVSQ